MNALPSYRRHGGLSTGVGDTARRTKFKQTIGGPTKDTKDTKTTTSVWTAVSATTCIVFVDYVLRIYYVAEDPR